METNDRIFCARGRIENHAASAVTVLNVVVRPGRVSGAIAKLGDALSWR